jgi:dTDP-4-amino-4,6-dideoxygalactose transaminase
MNVPFLDLRAQHAVLKSEILPLWEEILTSAGFIGGPQVKGFEDEFAAACGVQHCIAVNSGTDALEFIFEALEVGHGGEVIVPVNTFIATSEAVSKAGGQVVFVDVMPGTCGIDPEKVRAAITPRTRGIVPVHLYGQTADMDPVLDVAREHGLWVVEDAAQAHLAEYKGRKAGTMGVAAGFSFYPGKNLGACGDAGAVVTDDAALADKVRRLRDHGQAKKYHHDFEGHNGRCDAIQAAALRVKLKHLPEWNEARRAHAALYLELLRDVPGITLPVAAEGCVPVWHLFVILAERRDALAEQLQAQGISTGLHYPVPLHLQAAYARMGLGEGAFPVAEYCAARLLSLPMFPELTGEQIRYVCENVKAALRQV